MDMDREQILQYFQSQYGQEHGQYLHNVTFHLVNLILQQRQFPSIQSFIEFCENPENLRSWLPSSDDRVVFSTGLSQALRTIRAA